MRTQEGRDAVRPPQTHPSPRPAPTTRALRGPRRVPPRRHSPEPQEACQADPDAGTQNGLRDARGSARSISTPLRRRLRRGCRGLFQRNRSGAVVTSLTGAGPLSRPEGRCSPALAAVCRGAALQKVRDRTSTLLTIAEMAERVPHRGCRGVAEVGVLWRAPLGWDPLIDPTIISLRSISS